MGNLTCYNLSQTIYSARSKIDLILCNLLSNEKVVHTNTIYSSYYVFNL